MKPLLHDRSIVRPPPGSSIQQGDLCLRAFSHDKSPSPQCNHPALPPRALAVGEASRHAHVLTGRSGIDYVLSSSFGETYVSVLSDEVALVHVADFDPARDVDGLAWSDALARTAEHQAIALERGMTYRVTIPREADVVDAFARRVVD
jgi:hypothetical protein